MVLVPTHSPPVGFPSPSPPGGPHSSSGKPPTRRPVPPPSWSTPQTSTEDGSMSPSAEASASPSPRLVSVGRPGLRKSPSPAGRAPPARGGALGLPAYAYRDILADRDPSTVRDVAFARRGGPSRFCSGPRARRREGGVHPRRRGRSRPQSPAGRSPGDCDAPQDGHRPDERHLPNHRRKSNRAVRSLREPSRRGGLPRTIHGDASGERRLRGRRWTTTLANGSPISFSSCQDFAAAPGARARARVARTDALIARQDQDASTGTVSPLR